MPSDNRTYSMGGTCDDITSRFGTTGDIDDNPTMTMPVPRETLGYDILVSTSCTDTSIPTNHDAKLSVDDVGGMLLSIQDRLS